MAIAAEEAGFDSVWLGDHLLYDGKGPWEVWTQMAALAAVTERVTIGPLVACVGFHPPGADREDGRDDRRDHRRALRARASARAGTTASSTRSASRTTSGCRASRRRSRSSAARSPASGSRSTGAFHSAEDLELLPQPGQDPADDRLQRARGCSAIAAEHCTSWNTWWLDYGNTPEGFAELQATIPPHLERSACVLVQMPRRSSAVARGEPTRAAPVARRGDLVCSPITERSASWARLVRRRGDPSSASLDHGARRSADVPQQGTEFFSVRLGDRLGDLLRL